MGFVKVEELMKYSLIEFQEYRPLSDKNLGKWFQDIVWGFSTDEDARDVVEIGKNGCHGYIGIEAVCGLEVTQEILLDYGFIHIVNSLDSITYYRDDFGYVKLDTYGAKPVYMFGKNIRYFHNFQRVYYDYTGKLLSPKITEEPKKEHRFTFDPIKPHSADEMIKGIEEIKSRELPKTINKIKF